MAYAGTTSAAVDFLVFNLLLLGRGEPGHAWLLGANTVSFAGAMVVNYTLNARFTFGVRPGRRSALAYVVFTLFGLGLYNVNLLWIRGVLQADDTLMLNVAKVASMGLLVIWNYFGYQRFVFRPSIASAPSPDSLAPEPVIVETSS